MTESVSVAIIIACLAKEYPGVPVTYEYHSEWNKFPYTPVVDTSINDESSVINTPWTCDADHPSKIVHGLRSQRGDSM